MAFNIGLSGLRAATKDLNVTGNNIANAGTAGFKQSRAEFADVYAASMLGTGKNPPRFLNQNSYLGNGNPLIEHGFIGVLKLKVEGFHVREIRQARMHDPGRLLQVDFPVHNLALGVDAAVSQDRNRFAFQMGKAFEGLDLPRPGRHR